MIFFFLRREIGKVSNFELQVGNVKTGLTISGFTVIFPSRNLYVESLLLLLFFLISKQI